MIKYFPISRVILNLKTNGNAYTLNGESYVGSYYLTYDGKAYTGSDPVRGNNQLLQPYIANDPNQVPTQTPNYNNIKSNFREANAAVVNRQVQKLESLIPYYPNPTDTDYSAGYFTRYFAKRSNDPGYIVEISYEDWTTIKNGTQDESMAIYEITDVFWQLVGPLNDKRVSQYEIKGGVYDTNKRTTETKAKSFRGLVEYIGGNYTKFARITP
jgi:hypothetical protein